MLCGHGSRDAQAVAEFAALAEKLKPRFPRLAGRLRLSRIRPAGHPRRARPAGRRRRATHPRRARHAVRRRPRQERHPLGPQHLSGAASPGSTIDYGRELGLDPKMLRAAGARIREALDAAATGIALARDAARRRRPRRLRSRRQLQRRQGHAHAVGGLWLRLGGDRLFRRHLPAGRAGAGEGGAARLPPHRRVPLFPLHRHPGAAHLRRDRRRRRAPSRRSSSSRRPI